MKNKAICIIALCALLLVGCQPSSHNRTENSILGTWEMTASWIDESNKLTEDNCVRLQFSEDLSGKEIVIANGTIDERDFTYLIVDGELHLNFEYGATRVYSTYQVDDKTLMLKHQNFEIKYDRIKEDSL